MKHLVLFLALLATTPCLRAEAVVTNVRAAQIPGTHQVRISYDLTASGPCTINVQATRYETALTIDRSAYSGDGIEAAASAGTGKIITLTIAQTTASGTNVKASALQNSFTKNLRFKVLATESSAPVTYGDMVLIPAGDFQMGDQSNPLEGYSDERPVHTVSVSAFYMAKYEVTKELWDSVRAWGAANGRGYTDLAVGNGSYASKGANHPVHSITWYDMVKWCNARSQMENLVPCYTVAGVTYKTGQSLPDCNWSANGYRLPTEAEWEKAARGGQTGYNFPWGNDITHEQANYYNSSFYSYDKSLTRGFHPTWSNNDNGVYPYSSPVGSFAANGYGLHDMAGNMWEWCWDWYGVYTAGSQTDPRGAASGSYRMFRGGSWAGRSDYCRVAYRYGAYFRATYTTDSNNNMGFRPARDFF